VHVEEAFPFDELIGKLREADILISQGKKMVDVIKKSLMVPEEGTPPRIKPPHFSGTERVLPPLFDCV
jgi:hypothetical protein